MLMLQRAAENVNPSECNDPAVLLACSLGSDSCPAACQKKADEKADEDGNTPSNISDMPVAGDLTIAVADYSSEVRSIPMVGTVVFNAVDFKASEKVTIESVKLERTGLSDKSAIKWVWFEKDGVAVSAKASLSSDGTVTTRFYNNYSVNGTDTLDLVVDLNAATAWAEIAFKIIGATTTAKNVSLNTTTSTYRTTNYSVSQVTFAINGTANAVEYKVGESKTFEIGKFKLTNDRKWAEDKDVVVKSLKLKNNGTLDLGEALKNVYVTRDSKTVSSKVELNNKDMIIYFDNEEIVSGRSNVYTIFTEVAQLNETEKTVKLWLNKESDLVANEKSTNFRVSIPAASKVNLSQYTFKGGKVAFTNDSNMAKTVNAAAGSSDVVIARGTLTVSEPIKLGKITFTTNESEAPVVPVWATAAESSMIKDLKIEIGGSTYYTNAACTATATTNSCVYTSADDEIYVSKTSEVRVLLNIKNAANIDNDTISLVGYLNGTAISYNNSTTEAWRYDNSDESVLNKSEIAGSIQYAKLTVKAGKLNLTNKSSTTQKVVKGNSDEVVLFDGEITAKEGRVSVNEIKVTAPSFSNSTPDTGKTLWRYNLQTDETVDLTLYVNGESFSTISFRGNDTTAVDKSFNSLGDVESDKSMKVKITAQPTISRAGDVTFEIQAKGSDSQGNAVESTRVTTAKLEVTGQSEATIATSNASSTVVKDGSNAELVSFKTTIKNWSYDLSNVVVTASGLGTASATLAIDGKDVDSANASAWTITFNNINETLAIGSHTLTVKANLNADTMSTVKVTKVDMNNWLADASSKDLDVTKLVAKAFPVISASKSSDDLTLTIKNPKDSEENIDILGFNINGKIVTASFDNKSLTVTSWATTLADLNNEIASKGVSIAPDSETKLILQAAKASTVQVSAIIIRIGNDAPVVITDDYSNIGEWTSFKITASGDKEGNGANMVKESNPANFVPNLIATVSIDAPAATTYSSGTSATDIVTLTTTVTPTGATATPTWSSSDATIASVSAGGVVTAQANKVGKVTITATLPNGKKDSIELTIQ